MKALCCHSYIYLEDFQMAKWYAGAVITREVEGIREYLVIDTRSTNPKYAGRPVQMKFLGGTEEYHDLEDKTILDTLCRELTEESDMVLPTEYQPLLIFGTSVLDHFKNFYEIPFEVLTGDLRTIEKSIEGDWMSAPYWITFNEARGLYGHHYTALLKSEERYLAKRKKVEV